MNKKIQYVRRNSRPHVVFVLHQLIKVPVYNSPLGLGLLVIQYMYTHYTSFAFELKLNTKYVQQLNITIPLVSKTVNTCFQLPSSADTGSAGCYNLLPVFLCILIFFLMPIFNQYNQSLGLITDEKLITEHCSILKLVMYYQYY